MVSALVGVPAASVAQRASERRVANPGETQFDVQLLRPSGGPVVPIFEGWYPNPDGTYELSFGYFNVNTEGNARRAARCRQLHRADPVRRGTAESLRACARRRSAALGRLHGHRAG